MQKLEPLTLLASCLLTSCAAKPETSCAALEQFLMSKNGVRVVEWVDSQAAAGRLDSRYEIPARTHRPGAYAVPLDPRLGLGPRFEARVLEDEKHKPVGVFIGNQPFRGFVVELPGGERLSWPPIKKDFAPRILMLCAESD